MIASEFELASNLAHAFRTADNEDRLVFPSEVLLLLECFQAIWPHYAPIMRRVRTDHYDQITMSMQPGTSASFDDPLLAANAMACLMAQFDPEFEARRPSPADLLTHARRVRSFSSNIAGCARAVSRVLQALLVLRARPTMLHKRVLHYVLIERPLRRTDGALLARQARLRSVLDDMASSPRPFTTRL